jgi:hypothetical protein
MNSCLPWNIPASDGDAGKISAAAGAQVVRRLIVVMLLTMTALDLTRCGLVMAAARHPVRTGGLVTAALGILLAITVLATAGRVGRRDAAPEILLSWTGRPRGDPEST